MRLEVFMFCTRRHMGSQAMHGIANAIANNDCLILEPAMAQHFGKNDNLAINVTVSRVFVHCFCCKASLSWYHKEAQFCTYRNIIFAFKLASMNSITSQASSKAQY